MNKSNNKIMLVSRKCNKLVSSSKLIVEAISKCCSQHYNLSIFLTKAGMEDKKRKAAK